MINKPGIYKITNKADGKIYIGQAKNIYKRWKQHKKRTYLEDLFSYEVIMECDTEQLNFWEIAWIASERSCDPSIGYNKTIGGTDIKCISPGEETRAKLSASSLGNKNFLGLKHTDEAKVLMSKNSGRSKACIVNDIQYVSCISAATSLGINNGTLKAYLGGRRSWPDGMSGHYLDKKS